MDRQLRELMKASLEINAYLGRISDYAPSRIVGTSEDGLVDITVDRNGHITNCTIAEDWSRTLDPPMLESDINDALTQAQSQRMEIATQGIEKDNLPEPQISDDEIARAVTKQQQNFESRPSFFLHREPLEIGEDFIALADQVLNSDELSTPQTGTVDVTLTVGLATQVALNYDWAERRGGSIIARAVVLASNAAQQQSNDDALDNLMSESIGFLSRTE